MKKHSGNRQSRDAADSRIRTGNEAQGLSSGDRLLRVSEVAKTLSVSSRTIWRMTDRGELPRPVRIGTRMVRWRESEIEAYIADGLGPA